MNPGAMAFGSSMGMLEEGEAGAGVFKSELQSSPPVSGSSYFWGSSRSSSEGSSFGGSAAGIFSDSSFAETESSEDDDFVAGLAEQMAHSMLDDSDDNTSCEIDSLDSSRPGGLWGEPLWSNRGLQFNSSIAEAELKTGSGWYNSCNSHNNSNSNTGYWSSGYSSSCSGSKVSSPPSTPGGAEDGWDSPNNSSNNNAESFPVDDNKISGGYLPEVHWRNNAFTESRGAGAGAGTLPVLTKPYAAVVAQNRGWSSSEDDRRPPTQTRGATKQAPPPLGVWNNSRAQQAQVTQTQQQQSLPPARCTYRCGTGAAGAPSTQRPLGPPWQQGPPPPSGSVMRAVFLGGSGDRSSTGTGVFLPRSCSDYTKRKTSCSSVLLPSRIVQVLNLNVDDMRCQPSSVAPVAPGNGDEGWASSSSSSSSSNSSSQWKTYTYCSQLHQPDESTLPTEWSY